MISASMILIENHVFILILEIFPSGSFFEFSHIAKLIQLRGSIRNDAQSLFLYYLPEDLIHIFMRDTLKTATHYS